MTLPLLRAAFLALLFTGLGALLVQLLAGRALQGVFGLAGLAPARRLAGFSLALGVLAMPPWLVVQAGEMTGGASEAWSAGAVLGDAWFVLWQSSFGEVWLWQFLAILAATLLSWWGLAGRIAAIGAAMTAVLLHGLHGHFWAMAETIDLTVLLAMAHLLAAAIWLGSLPGLALLVWRLPARPGAALCRSFAPLGGGCVLVLLVTILANQADLIGGIDGLLATLYGWVVLTKAACFAVLLLCALANRLAARRALGEANAEAGRRWLLWGISVETLAAVMLLLAAASLSATEPGMHTGHFVE